MTPGTRVKALTGLGLVARDRPTSRFLGKVEPGALGTVVELPTEDALPGNWEYVQFDGFETVTDPDSPWSGEELVAPVLPTFLEVLPR